MRIAVRYPSVLLTAVVAGVYSVVVCALLLFAAAHRLTKVPLDAPQFLALKKRLAEQPGNDALRNQLRALDLRLRKQYVREQRFTELGGYLLLAGVAVTLAAAKWAATLRRRLPKPTVPEPGFDLDERISRYGLVAVGILALLLVGTMWAMTATSRSVLPDRIEQLAALSARSKSAAAGRSAVLPSEKPKPLTGEVPPAEQRRRNWPSFRGPDGSGISAYANVPRTWDGESGKGILWKAPTLLPGASSPIVWEDRVFLSGATKDRRQVYCFDADTGRLVWTRSVAGQGKRAGRPVKVGPDTGFAAPTMATDGLRVYAMFATGDVAAFDFSGNPVWCRSLGVPKNTYGHAASLATYRDRLIVQLDQATAKEGLSRLLALDGPTGKTVWQAARAVPNCWASPIVVEHEGQPRIITSGDPWVIAYRPDDGTEIWRAKCLEGDIGPSPVYAGGTVFVASQFPALSAIRAGGRGDVTQTHILWQADIGLPDICSPLVTDEFVLLVASYGTLTCYDRKKGGEPLWEEDFEDTFMSSPSLVGRLVYLFSEQGKSWIVEPGREGCRRVAEAQLGEPCVTSPAFQDGRIYIRGKKHLFCIGSKSRAAVGRRPPSANLSHPTVGRAGSYAEPT